MAQLQQLRRNLPDTLGSTQNRHPDLMVVIQSFHQIFKHHAVRSIHIHADLLIDDPPLLFHAFLREIGCSHKFQQQLQRCLKIIGTGKIIGRHVVAGKGIDVGAQLCQLCGHVPPRQIEHFVFQIVGNTCRNFIAFPIQFKKTMDRAVIRDEISQFPGKAGTRHHFHRQSIGQCFPIDLFPQLGIFKNIHASTPLRK